MQNKIISFILFCSYLLKDRPSTDLFSSCKLMQKLYGRLVNEEL